MTQNFIADLTTRRTFLGGTAALAACAVMPRSVFGADACQAQLRLQRRANRLHHLQLSRRRQIPPRTRSSASSRMA